MPCGIILVNFLVEKIAIFDFKEDFTLRFSKRFEKKIPHKLNQKNFSFSTIFQV